MPLPGVDASGNYAEAMNRPPAVPATVAATGSVTADAAVLPLGGMVVVTAGDGTKGVRLPAGARGSSLVVVNTASGTCKVYPSAGGTIDYGSADAAYSLATHKAATFHAYTDLAWYAVLTA